MPKCANPYQDWELEAIRQHYPNGGPQAVINAGVKRSVFSLRTKANAMGVLLSASAMSEVRRQIALKTQNLHAVEEKPVPPEYLAAPDIFQVGARVAQSKEFA